MNITLHNYEEYLIDYLHGELNVSLQQEMKLFLQKHPSFQEEYELLQQTIFTPDTTIVFEEKNFLLKPFEQKPLITSYKKYFAAAAIMAGILGGAYLFTIEPSQNKIAKENLIKENTTNATPQKPKNKKEIEDVATIEPQKVAKTSNTKIQKLEKKDIHKPYENKSIATKKQEHKKDIIDNTALQQEKRNQEKEIFITQETPTHYNLAQETITQEMPKEENKLVANNMPSSKNIFEIDDKKQPKLFALINKVIKTKNKFKNKAEAIAQTEVTVMLGNKKLFNVNN